MTKLDLGCGVQKKPEFIGIDKNNNSQADYLLDITKDTFPFEDGTVEEINCGDVIEHISYADMINVMNESWRVLKENGIMIISTVYGIKGWKSHPCHIRPIFENQFDYFKKTDSETFNNMRETDGIKCAFSIEKIENNRDILSFKLRKESL